MKMDIFKNVQNRKSQNNFEKYPYFSLSDHIRHKFVLSRFQSVTILFFGILLRLSVLLKISNAKQHFFFAFLNMFSLSKASANQALENHRKNTETIKRQMRQKATKYFGTPNKTNA
jgi:hypothetical protein